MNSTRAGLQLCWGLLALTGCAGGHTQPGPPPTPHGHTLMQWTAADNRVAWIVLDSASDLDGVNRQLLRDMSRDVKTGPRIDRVPLPPFPFPKSVIGASYTATFIIDERGKVERIALTAFDDRDYTRKVMTDLRRARFKPALKADGTPTRSVMVLKMSLPRIDPFNRDFPIDH